MMKFITAFSMVLILFSGVAFAKSEGGVPFAEIWQRIDDLQKQINLIELIPGPQGEIGPAGPEGPKGEPGTSGGTVAGDVAFFNVMGDKVLVLGTDNVVYLLGNETQWFRDDMLGRPGINPPIPHEEILRWEHLWFLDRNGDVWRYDNGRVGGPWYNLGHP